MASPAPDQDFEAPLLAALLAGLEACDQRAIELAQGKIFGLHQARLQLYVGSRLSGRPKATAEEVFGNVVVQITSVLFSPEKIRNAQSIGSLGPLFFTIARNEIANFWRRRPPYGDDLRAITGMDLEAVVGLRPVESDGDPLDELAGPEAVGSISKLIGGPGGFDGLLFELTVIAGIKLREIEALLLLAERSDTESATSEASALLGIKPLLAGQYLEMIRECTNARPMRLNALKVAVHRARKRAAEKKQDEEKKDDPPT